MNRKPIRVGIALLIVFALAGCASQRTGQLQAAEFMCDPGETMTCEEHAGEYRTCFCANRAELRRIFGTLATN